MNELSDDELLVRCVYYGEEARKWRNKFLGLLPEVSRRNLYKAKGFESIFHFAFVLGGVNGKQVVRVLRLHERLKYTPTLQILLERGTVGIHKMERVASIAEPKNQEFLADQVQMLSKQALDTLVRDEKSTMPDSPYVRRVELPHQFILAEDVEGELQRLHHKGIDVNGELRLYLIQRKECIDNEKMRLGVLANERKSVSGRYIPIDIKNILKKEYGKICSIDACNKPSNDIHHLQRFGYVRQHNPQFMAPLCREHHQIAHSIDVRVQEVKKSRPP
ncbi:MAG: hypothetical protein NTX63_00035 [Candidatus Peregrinibacteria bacterium]|nr:hypothetical protein [Candidatus Peregrinibacteria bacterium]